MKWHGTQHHRKPRSKGGLTTPRNISIISQKRHRAWHILFSNWEPSEIAQAINVLYLDPDWEFVPRRKIE